MLQMLVSDVVKGNATNPLTAENALSTEGFADVLQVSMQDAESMPGGFEALWQALPVELQEQIQQWLDNLGGLPQGEALPQAAMDFLQNNPDFAAWLEQLQGFLVAPGGTGIQQDDEALLPIAQSLLLHAQSQKSVQPTVTQIAQVNQPQTPQLTPLQAALADLPLETDAIDFESLDLDVPGFLNKPLTGQSFASGEGFNLKQGLGESFLAKTPLNIETSSAVLSDSFNKVLQEAFTGLNNTTLSTAAANRTFSPAVTQSLLAMPVPEQVSQANWGSAVGERLIWMAKGDQQFAELKISPPNLGPLEVKLTINNEQASVSFVSNHAVVRDAIEQALPRLREMFQQEQLQLSQVNVGDGRAQQQQAQQQAHQHQQGQGSSEVGTEEADLASESHVVEQQHSNGLLDIFA